VTLIKLKLDMFLRNLKLCCLKTRTLNLQKLQMEIVDQMMKLNETQKIRLSKAKWQRKKLLVKRKSRRRNSAKRKQTLNDLISLISKEFVWGFGVLGFGAIRN